MIQKGDKIDPKLELTVNTPDGDDKITLEELLKQPTVFSIYMRNNTSACDKQNVSLVGNAEKIRAKGWQVVAISRDTCGSHQKYREKHQIPYPLVSDKEDLFARSIDGLIEKSMYGKKFLGPARAALFVDKQGTVKAVIPKLNPAKHGEEILKTIEELQ